MRSIQCGRSGDKSRHPADETAFRRMAVDDIGTLLADYPYCLPQGLHVFQQIKVALQCCQVFFHFPSVAVDRPAVVCLSVHDDVFNVTACEGYGVADIDIQAADELAYVEHFHAAALLTSSCAASYTVVIQHVTHLPPRIDFGICIP